MTEQEMEGIARRAAVGSGYDWEALGTDSRQRWLAEVRAAIAGAAHDTDAGRRVAEVMSAGSEEAAPLAAISPTCQTGMGLRDKFYAWRSGQ